MEFKAENLKRGCSNNLTRTMITLHFGRPKQFRVVKTNVCFGIILIHRFDLLQLSFLGTGVL